MGNRHRFLLAASFLYLAAANLIWIARDDRPPFWDMAAHQTWALQIYDAFASSGLRAILSIPYLTGSYPPFYHSVVAAFYAVFGKTVDAAQWANLPAIALLFIATYGIGRELLDPFPAALAAVIVNFYPILVWLSRETLIDYWLTAITAAAMWLLLCTREFSSRRYGILFGIVCGIGMLTKWTFVFFVALPAFWYATKNFKNAFIAALAGLVVAASWYALSLHRLAMLLAINNAGAISEGDPGRLSWQSIVFYVRVLEGYQLFLPMFLAFLAGAYLLANNWESKWTPIVLWILGGWAGLLLFQNKDPRYTAPLLPAVALVTCAWFHRREYLALIFIPILLFEHYLVSFGIPQLPPAVVLLNGQAGPLPWNWNLYTQRYFNLWGPPAREDWKIQYVLQAIARSNRQSVRLGMVPDIPRFDTQAFEFYIARDHLPVTIDRLTNFYAETIRASDYVLASEKDRGFEAGSAFTDELARINYYVSSRPETFQMVDRFSLPNGDVIRLYKVVHT